MKKKIATLGLLIPLLASCKPVQNEIVIKACDETAAYRELIFSSSGTIGTTKEQQIESFNQAKESLKNRGEQTLKDAETKHIVEKTQYDLGNVYSLTDGSYSNILFYIHGGAWIYEIDPLHISFCDEMVDELDAKVCMPLYPLAPDSSYKDGYKFVEEVYDELLKENKPIIIMGDSAGGTITLGLVLKLKEEKKKLPEKVVVMSPCADATLSNPEIDEYEKIDGYLPRYFCSEAAKEWADGDDITQYLLSPINGNYKKYPDTLMFAGDHDILFPDQVKLFNKMCESKINVTLVKGEGLWHVFPVSHIQERTQCVQIIKDFCK